MPVSPYPTFPRKREKGQTNRCANFTLKRLNEVKTGNNLRDHMTDLELIFTMLGEAGTTEIARRKDAQGFTGNRKGGTIAGDARKALEAKSGKPVVSKANYLAPHVAASLEDAATATPKLSTNAAIKKKPAKRNKP